MKLFNMKTICAAAILLNWAEPTKAAEVTDQSHQTSKRDIRGFRLGMPFAEAQAAMLRQCFSRFCAPTQCPRAKDLKDLHTGGSVGDVFSAGRGEQYMCRLDTLTVELNVTPVTEKVYKIFAAIGTRMNCEEQETFIMEQFNLPNTYTKIEMNPCNIFDWTLNDGVKIRLSAEMGAIDFQMTDTSIIKEEEDKYDAFRKKLDKPRL